MCVCGPMSIDVGGLWVCGVYVYMQACVYVYVYVYMWVCIDMYVPVMYVCVSMQIRVYE